MNTQTTRGDSAIRTPGETTASPQERRRMIAVAAYLRAERRGFVGGDAEADWLAAEAEVERRLVAYREEKERELAAFQRMYKEARRALEDVREKISAETIRDALDKASAALRQAGEYSGETVSKVGEALKKDLAGAAERLAPKWEAVSEDAAGLFAVWQGRSRAFLGGAAAAGGDWLKELGSRLEHRSYRTGELTGGGTFECTRCGERQVLAQPNHLAECPKCQGNEFRRV